MRTPSWTTAARTVRSTPRPAGTTLVPVAIALVAALALWWGAPAPLAVPVAVAAVGLVLFGAARRSLREASARIDTILREELDDR